MIDEKKIEKAAEEYAMHSCVEDEYPGTELDAFKAGVEWAIKQLLNRWHHKSEVPNGEILYIDDANFPHGMEWYRDDHYDEDWDAVIDVEHIKGWIYVKDLLPMMKKCLD